jgi:hypothetical protein
MTGTLMWQFVKWHKLIGDNLADRFLRKPLPAPSARDRQLEQALREELTRPSAATTLPTWVAFREQVRRDFDAYDPRTFLRWSIVQHSMCLTNSGAVVPEYLALRQSPQWSRYEPALEDPGVGDPVPFIYYPRSNGNLLHHCYHLMRFEELTGRDLSQMEVIVEFGGGYGNMCALLHRLGFKGRYFIYDLPEFTALQRYYLASLGFTLHTDGSTAPGVTLLSDLDALRAALGTVSDQARRGFIATWSLSESPVELRERFLPLVESFDALLLAFQGGFYGVDNSEYFDQFRARTQDRIQWTKKHLPQLPRNYYLFGKRTCR